MLHALVEFARAHELAVEPGFKAKTVRWLLVFSETGDFLGVQDQADGPTSRGRLFERCPDLSQPELKGGGAGCRHFLVDSLDVVALLTKGEPDKKLVVKHHFFTSLLQQAGSADSRLEAVGKALDRNETIDSIKTALSAQPKVKPTDLATFALVNESTGAVDIPVSTSVWHEWWRGFRRQLGVKRERKAGRKKSESGTAMLCLLSGELVIPASTHGKIEGLSNVGGLAMGDALASFKQPSFCSYGLEQAANAAMSERMVETYRASLNRLIRDQSRSRKMAETRIVYWYTERVEPDEDVIREVLGDLDFGAGEQDEETDFSNQQKEIQATSKAKQLLAAIRSGERPDLERCRFRALTLSANSGRVVVRDWMEGQFEKLVENVDTWFDNLAVVHRDGTRVVRKHKFGAVLAATSRKLKDVARPVVTELWRCALNARREIPLQVAIQCLARVRIDFISDDAPSHARLGLLKAFWNRRHPGREELKMTEELNDDFDRLPAYLYGRLLAILGQIQQTALRGVKATVIQRYYGAASTSPALVLGRLVRLANVAHLPKIKNQRLRHWYETQLARVWEKVKAPPQKTLTLEEQTVFAMGYYHQLADFSRRRLENRAKARPKTPINQGKETDSSTH